MKYTLKKPVQFGETFITELIFREEPVSGDLRGIAIRDPMLWDDMLRLTGRLTGQPDAVINRLSMPDTIAISGIVSGFFVDGPETGTAPSQ